MKGGFDLGLGTIIGIIGVLIVGIFGFMFIGSGSLDNIIQSFCSSTGFCGNQTTVIGAVAFESTKALACAVNSVAAGQELDCVRKLEENKPNGPYVSCLKPEELICCDTGKLFGWGGGEYWAVKKNCEKDGRFEEKPTPNDECGEIFKDKRPQFMCGVANFELPQKVSKAEEWIAYYGDPYYLVYWQNFPYKQDRWTFRTDWRIHAASLVVFSLPAGRAFKMLKDLKILPKFAELGTTLKATGSLAKNSLYAWRVSASVG